MVTHYNILYNWVLIQQELVLNCYNREIVMFFFTQAGLNCTGFFRSESLTWLKHIIIYSGSKVFQPVMTDCEVVLLSGVVFYDFGRESGPDWGAQVETQLFK